MIRGYDDVVERLSQVAVDEKDRPRVPIVIVNCGELELRKIRQSLDDKCTCVVPGTSCCAMRCDELILGLSPTVGQAAQTS